MTKKKQTQRILDDPEEEAFLRQQEQTEAAEPVPDAGTHVVFNERALNHVRTTQDGTPTRGRHEIDAAAQEAARKEVAEAPLDVEGNREYRLRLRANRTGTRFQVIVDHVDYGPSGDIARDPAYQSDVVPRMFLLGVLAKARARFDRLRRKGPR